MPCRTWLTGGQSWDRGGGGGGGGWRLDRPSCLRCGVEPGKLIKFTGYVIQVLTRWPLALTLSHHAVLHAPTMPVWCWVSVAEAAPTLKRLWWAICRNREEEQGPNKQFMLSPDLIHHPTPSLKYTRPFSEQINLPLVTSATSMLHQQAGRRVTS